MKKMMIGILTGFLLLGIAAAPSFAAQCGCGEPLMGPGMMHGGPGFTEGSPQGHFLWKKLMALNLTDKQKDALKGIRERVEKEAIKKRADLQLAHVELQELLDKTPVDMSAVEASLKKSESSRTDLHLSFIKAREEVKALLTPDQRAKLKDELEAGFMAREGRCGCRGMAASSEAK